MPKPLSKLDNLLLTELMKRGPTPLRKYFSDLCLTLTVQHPNDKENIGALLAFAMKGIDETQKQYCKMHGIKNQPFKGAIGDA